MARPITLPGALINADWIHVCYKGTLLPGARTDAAIDGVTYGWVTSWQLVWTGNILELPVDGVETVSTVRAAGAVIYVYLGRIIYEGSA